MKDVLVTGASGGIGYETALKMALDGHRVFALSRNETRLMELTATAARSGGLVVPIAGDIASGDFSVMDRVFEQNGPVHISVLLHNAGTLITKPFEQLGLAEWKAIYDVNVFGVAMLTKHLLGRMGGAGHTHIVMCGSIGGMVGSVKFKGLSAYSSSKGALAVLAECLAEEFRDRNISVNCLALGSVQTEMLSKAFPGYQAPLKPAEMAEFVSDFCVRGWKYLNGKTLPVSLSNP
jgi:3-oxoacyl-[acyl-carrier protein] reductase